MKFSHSFLWGAATAAYQIEGAANIDGKGPSIWDVFAHQPGHTWNDQSGDVACDHYHHFAEDVRLMQTMGLQAYRFSIAWSRVLPNGTGSLNPKGLDFYDRLIDALLVAGIEPFVTLYHWDLPYALHLKDGWLNPDSPDWFSEYAARIASRFSDRVRHWMTFNEPQIFTHAGYVTGVHAPGLTLSRADTFQLIHHILLAHGRAVQVLRAQGRQPLQVGLATCGFPAVPATETPADIEAARQYMFSLRDSNPENNTWWLDPIFLGAYPDDGKRLFADHLPIMKSEDFTIIRQPLDFFAVNFYFGPTIRMSDDGKPERLPHPPGYAHTGFREWPITPEILYWGPRFYQARYHLPIYITENGCSNPDRIFIDGKVHDPQRIDFLRRYLTQLHRAVKGGVDVRGYFYWSLMDNVEWADGVKARFGLLYIDYPTQKRLLKDSAHWYAQMIKSGGVVDGGL
ncbi:beta-glucosidase [candidate division KSB1 bacterium]|nr:beta-glucosidase [candidate division KSB1 bacterium]